MIKLLMLTGHAFRSIPRVVIIFKLDIVKNVALLVCDRRLRVFLVVEHYEDQHVREVRGCESRENAFAADLQVKVDLRKLLILLVTLEQERLAVSGRFRDPRRGNY